MEKDIASLQHTTWRCQYHVVFAPKYRRMAIYGQIKADIGVILRKLCEQKGVEIIQAEACPDHIHMLISIPPKYSVAQIMGYLKGKSSLMIIMSYELWTMRSIIASETGLSVSGLELIRELSLYQQSRQIAIHRTAQDSSRGLGTN